MFQSYGILLYRSIVYLVGVFVFGIFSRNLVLEGALNQETNLFLILTVISTGQFLLSFRPPQARATFALFLSDAALIMALVKVSGSSASPFLVLFPLLALIGTIIFSTRFSILLTLATMLFAGQSVEWGLSIVSNFIAIASVALLGLYLNKALLQSGQALERSESARRRLENLQKAILANIPSGLISVDPEGQIIQLNSVGEKILGIPEADLLYKPVRTLIPGFEHEFDSAMVADDGAHRGPDDEVVPRRPVLEFVSADGRKLKLGYSRALLHDPKDRGILGTLVVFQDLTRVIQLEDDLRKSEKLAAVGKLAAGIAHEIRNPLAGISGSAQLLTSSPAFTPEDHQLLGIIKRESSRLDSLISEFLDYVRTPKLELKSVNLVEVVRQTLDALQVSSKWVELGCRVDFALQGADGEGWILGDGGKVTQVLMNLILNAGQAGAKQVKINIGPGPFLEVCDNGHGMSPESQARLFEPFFTTKEKGTGLGLATSYRLLEAMDAQIKVFSPAPDFCPSGGTIFLIEFKLGMRNQAARSA